MILITVKQVMLNPRRWGRLCGEQEDVKVWLARYLGVQLRVCCPLDWDHVWTEVFDGQAWQPLDPDCVNFARRLGEGIGAWTRVLALGTPLSGPGPAAATEDATEAYLLRAGGSPAELEDWRGRVAAARADASGALTQSKTLCGRALEAAGLDDAAVTAELRVAQAGFDRGLPWWDLGDQEDLGTWGPGWGPGDREELATPVRAYVLRAQAQALRCTKGHGLAACAAPASGLACDLCGAGLAGGAQADQDNNDDNDDNHIHSNNSNTTNANNNAVMLLMLIIRPSAAAPAASTPAPPASRAARPPRRGRSRFIKGGCSGNRVL